MAFFNNLPEPIQSAIQLGYLDRTFKQALTAQLGYRVIADRMEFPGGLGQTITDTKMGLLPQVTAPMAVRANSDLTDGLTNSAYPLEQYTIGISPYANTMQLQLASAAQVIDSLYLQNAYALGENANRSIDGLCYTALMNAYLGGNTFVTATLGAAGTAVHVNDVRGFFESVNVATGKVIATGTGNPMVVQVGAANLYSLVGVIADGVQPALDFTFTNLTFSGTATNVSTTPGGFSGVLTFSTNVLVADGTLNNTVLATTAPYIVRPLSTGNVMYANSTQLIPGATMTMRMVRTAAAQMRSNGINSDLWCFTDDAMLASLFNDTEFRQYLQTRSDSTEFKDGMIARVMGVNYVRTNMALVDSTTLPGQKIHRAIITSPGALMEADFTSRAYANGTQDEVSSVSVVDNIAHITRPPINLLADVVNQTWSAYIGFCCPTDTTANPSVIPTANNASHKRSVILEAVEM